MNLRSPILKVINCLIRVGYPVYLAVAYLAVNLKGVLDDQMTVISSEVMHVNA